MTDDSRDHEYKPREDVRENDEDEDTVTQEDIDLAEQDLRDRESDLVDATTNLQSALFAVRKAKENRDDLKANLGKPKLF
jgi:hypothetical protein